MERIQSDAVPPSTSATPSRWRSLASRALPLRYPLLILAFVVVVTIGQLVEDALDTPTLELLPPSVSIPRSTLILLTLYMLVMLRVIQQTAATTVRVVRPVVKCDDQAYESLSKRMTRIHVRTDLVLMLISVAIVAGLFPLLNSPLPITNNPLTHERTFLPKEPLSAFLVLVAYSLVGWAGLSLVVNTIRLGYALGDLTQKPLMVDVFDSDKLLPLGRLALVLSLAPVGVVLILLIGLGTPTRPLAWFALVLASLAGMLALILPLRGVHRQMAHARTAALSGMNHELAEIHKEVIQPTVPDLNRTAQLANRTGTLVNLRKVVQESPTWPFYNTIAISRALLIAAAPLIYTILNELLRTLVIVPLTR